jgi:hypothetical protein
MIHKGFVALAPMIVVWFVALAGDRCALWGAIAP